MLNVYVAGLYLEEKSSDPRRFWIPAGPSSS
jgi:hypothetical protein